MRAQMSMAYDSSKHISLQLQLFIELASKSTTFHPLLESLCGGNTSLLLTHLNQQRYVDLLGIILETVNKYLSMQPQRYERLQMIIKDTISKDLTSIRSQLQETRDSLHRNTIIPRQAESFHSNIRHYETINNQKPIQQYETINIQRPPYETFSQRALQQYTSSYVPEPVGRQVVEQRHQQSPIRVSQVVYAEPPLRLMKPMVEEVEFEEYQEQFTRQKPIQNLTTQQSYGSIHGEQRKSTLKKSPTERKLQVSPHKLEVSVSGVYRGKSSGTPSPMRKSHFETARAHDLTLSNKDMISIDFVKKRKKVGGERTREFNIITND